MSKTENYSAEFAAGDETAFKRLYEDTSTMLYRAVFRLTGSREDTEDILHDVYIKAYQARRSYRPQLSSLQTWLYRIAVNHALNFLKRKKWLSGNLGRIFGMAERSEQTDYVDAEESEELQTLLQQVPEIYRVCVVMRDIEDRSYEEIAEVLRLAPGTVKSRLSRGRQMLKDLYEGSET